MKFDLLKYLAGILLLVLGSVSYVALNEPLGIFWLCLSALHIHEATRE